MKLLSVKELAQELGVSLNTIRRAYLNGDIPSEWIGRVVRFDLAEVRKAMRKRAIERLRQQRGAGARVGGSRPRSRSQRPRRGNTGARIAAPKR